MSNAEFVIRHSSFVIRHFAFVVSQRTRGVPAVFLARRVPDARRAGFYRAVRHSSFDIRHSSFAHSRTRREERDRFRLSSPGHNKPEMQVGRTDRGPRRVRVFENDEIRMTNDEV